MARTVNEIQAELIANVQADSVLSTQLTSTSRRAIWRLWTFVFAVSIAILEQLMDVFKSQIEGIVAIAAPQTPQWLQAKIFEFQYSATDPQVIQLIDLVPQYPVVNTDLRIVTRCSVKTSLAGSVAIKVAKGATPEPLAFNEISALQSYVQSIGVAGIFYSIISSDSDKIYIAADIYYNGAYSAVIQDRVIASINTYLSELPFDGTLKLTDLEFAIKNTTGISDVVFKNVIARANSTPIGLGTFLVTDNQYVGRVWPTISGYITPETNAGYTLPETLNFIAE